MVDGISFGTNDLTAEAMGNIKRDDIAATREWMAKHNHVGKSPFLTLSKPVIHMMRQATELARKANPQIDIGICGHQVAGDASSIVQCQKLELDSISVPATAGHIVPSRIIAGQAALSHPRAITANGTGDKSFAGKHQKRDPQLPDGSGWGKGKEDKN